MSTPGLARLQFGLCAHLWVDRGPAARPVRGSGRDRRILVGRRRVPSGDHRLLGALRGSERAGLSGVREGGAVRSAAGARGCLTIRSMIGVAVPPKRRPVRVELSGYDMLDARLSRAGAGHLLLVIVRPAGVPGPGRPPVIATSEHLRRCEVHQNPPPNCRPQQHHAARRGRGPCSGTNAA